jgi:hypothetical protein
MSLPDREGLRHGETQGLLALYASIIDELLEREVVRSTNNPVADYAEYLTARAFGLTLVANANIGFDAIGEDDVRYQVKSRRLTAHNQSRQLGFTRGLGGEDDPFDFLVGILFEPDFRIRRAALVPVSVVRARAARVDYVNAWRFMLTENVWSLEGVRDITEAIREAAGAPVAAPAVVQTATVQAAPAPTGSPAWQQALARYREPRALRTRARGRPFTVASGADELRITPDWGTTRRMFAAEFTAAVPLIGRADRQELLKVTWNSSYLEAIVDDLRPAGAPAVHELTTLTPALLVKLGPWTDDDDRDLPRRGYGYRPGMSDVELYDSARAWWVLDPLRARSCQYAAAVVAGVIRGVWEIDHGTWRSIDGSRLGAARTRWAFDGRPVADAVAADFLGRAVPVMRPSGGHVFGSGAVVAYWPG